MTFHDYIVRDAAICGGEPIVKRTRVLVRGRLGHFAQNESTETIRHGFPSVPDEAIRAAIAVVSTSARES